MTIREKAKYDRHTAKDIAKRFLGHENAVLVLVLIVLVAVIGIITKGLTTTRVNIANVLLQSSIRGVASIGQAFVVLSAGIDISVGGVALLCSTLGATLMTTDLTMNIVGHPVSTYAAAAIMLIAGIGWGAVNGLSVSRLGMPPLIVTIAMWQITTGVAYYTGKGSSIEPLPDSLYFWGHGYIGGVSVPVIIFIAVAVVGYFFLNYTPFGRSVYAVGGNPVTAWLTGTKVKNIGFSVYVISGFLAGLAGLVMTARTMSSTMQSLSGLELDTIGAVFVGGISMAGGKGNLIGVILGVIIIGVINNAMSLLRASAAVQYIIKGAIIIIAVAIDYLRNR